MLEQKIAETLNILKRGETSALALNPTDGYYLAFSGGKDSQVLYSLAQLSGVKFKAYYSVTSIDPPQNVYFIREHYPDVKFVRHKENFFKLIQKHGLPTMNRRYCCERLKENFGAGNVVLTGVRAEESKRRAAYAAIEIFSRRKEHVGKPRERTFEQLEQQEFQCIKGKDKLMVRPILNWTETEVWEYIQRYNLPVNPCYASVGRVGCMFCPFSNRKRMEDYEKRYPGFKRELMRSLEIYWKKTEEHMLSTPEEYYDWWKSKQSVEKYKAQKSW